MKVKGYIDKDVNVLMFLFYLYFYELFIRLFIFFK